MNVNGIWFVVYIHDKRHQQHVFLKKRDQLVFQFITKALNGLRSSLCADGSSPSTQYLSYTADTS